MNHRCLACGAEFELGPDRLPECPNCIRSRMAHPDGLSTKHTPSGAAASSSYASYIADGVKPDEVFDYMSGGSHAAPSGCEVFFSKRHNSFNAISYQPLGKIPGSGIAPTGHHAADYAVLLDLKGSSSQGPHWMFADDNEIAAKRKTGEWIQAPK